MALHRDAHGKFTGKFECEGCGSPFDYLPEEPSDGHVGEFIHPDCPGVEKPDTKTSGKVGTARHTLVDEAEVIAHYEHKGKSYPGRHPQATDEEAAEATSKRSRSSRSSGNGGASGNGG